MAKKLLSQILRERTETIEYRKIKSQLMKIAQNEGTEMRILKITKETITMLENEGISVVRTKQADYWVYKLSW